MQLVPRKSAMEISYRGQLVFSKLQSKQWPNVSVVVTTCAKLAQEMDRGGNNVTKFLCDEKLFKLKSR